MIYPANFEQKVGFDRLREQVAALCTIRGGRERLCAEQFSTSQADVERRLAQHNAGTGARSTRGRSWVLLHVETFATRNEAMSREWHIKKLSRKEKEELMKGFQPDAGLLKEAEDEEH